MTSQNSRTVIAGEREAGVPCAHCGQVVELGQRTVVCGNCGTLHHELCWQVKPRCGGYECATSADLAGTGGESVLLVTRDELASAVPLPTRSSSDDGGASDRFAKATSRRWNRVGLWAFVISLLGIPLFGLVTGLIAVVIACIALVGHSRSQRGFGLTVAAIIIGIGEAVGWAIGLSMYFGVPQTMVSIDQMTLDPASLDELPERIARAMRANVVIDSAAGLGMHGLGSGVVLQVRDGSALIVTNRHVVDHHYTDRTTEAPNDLDSLGEINVMTVEQVAVPAKVEWIAPHGVDLAIVSVPVLDDEVEAAYWDRDAKPHIGDDVFAVGNPHGLGWTHSAGDISQVRRRTQDGYQFRILQTTAAINPGNSGGGLYDSSGRLIGINTLTGDKRVAEGLGFSIALPTLLELAPDRLQLPDRYPEAPSE